METVKMEFEFSASLVDLEYKVTKLFVTLLNVCFSQGIEAGNKCRQCCHNVTVLALIGASV
jgi:hypothetical protein